MPQLGMTQDTGVILSWLKSAGDKVEADDILMEVETDKATMEVEAGASGIVAELRAEAGTEVAVGETVALIETDAASNAAESREPDPLSEKTNGTLITKAKEEEARATRSVQRSQESAPAPAMKDKPNAHRRILASPKARYLAKSSGIDLRRLARSGVPEPIHAADVQSAAYRTPVPARAMLSTEVSGAEFNALLELAEKDGVKIERSAAIAAFAAAAYRHAKEVTGTVSVELVSFEADGVNQRFKNPDGAGLAHAASAPAHNAPDIVVHDLIGTRFDDSPADGDSEILTLTVSESPSGDALKLHLRFAECGSPSPAATAFLDGFSMRLENPICHIL